MNTEHNTDLEHEELKKKLGTLELLVFVVCLLIAGIMSADKIDPFSSDTADTVEIKSGK